MNRKLRSARKLHSPASSASSVLRKLGLDRENPGVFCGEWLGSGDLLKSISPINGQVLATVRTATADEYERSVKRAQTAFHQWQQVPAPKRGDVIRWATPSARLRLTWAR